MIIEDEKDNILNYGRPTGTIELKAHPEDVIDVPADILAVMNARLKGENFADTYGDEDCVSKELLIQQERRKLGRIFGSETEIMDAFSSLRAIKEIRAELAFENVDRELLAAYTQKLSQREAVDEVDGYCAVLFAKPVQTKRQRLDRSLRILTGASSDVQKIFTLLAPTYAGAHFEVLGITKEILQLQEGLRSLMISGKLLPLMDELLREFYGWAHE